MATACNAPANSCTACSARVSRHQLGERGAHRVRIPIGAALDLAEYLPAAIDQKARRQAARGKGVVRRAFRVEIDIELVEAEFGEEGFYYLGAAAILGHRHYCQSRPEPVLQRGQRRHLLKTGLAPRCPQVK